MDSKSINPNISISPCTNRSFLLYNQPPFTPFLWPIIHSSNPLQLHGSQTLIIPSEVSMPNIANPVLFHEQENPGQTNAPSTPVYVLPFPWFVPVPDHGNESSFRPSFDLNDYQSRASSSSKTIARVEKRSITLCCHQKLKEELLVQYHPYLLTICLRHHLGSCQMEVVSVKDFILKYWSLCLHN